MFDNEVYKCRSCGLEYDPPKIEGPGFTFWNCPGCGIEDGIHINVGIPVQPLGEAEKKELEYKAITLCSVLVIYSGVKDIPKFKQYSKELSSLGNSAIHAQLHANGGMKYNAIPLLDAEGIKENALVCGLEVEIYV